MHFPFLISPANGKLRDQIFLDSALGAAYTPLSIDGEGRILTQNNGHLFVVGNGRTSPLRAPRGAALLRPSAISRTSSKLLSPKIAAGGSRRR
jgi:hypothetical protein